MSKVGTRALQGLAILLAVFGLLFFGSQGFSAVFAGHPGGWVFVAVGLVLVALAGLLVFVVRRRIRNGK